MAGAELTRFADFIIERHEIWRRRASGQQAPWTNDPILQSNRFCNVYRELDKETRWIAANWRSPNKGDPELWFAMLVARVVNWSPTLAELGYPVPWKLPRFLNVLKDRRERGEKVWTGAYMVTTHSAPMDKIDYYGYRVLSDAWHGRHMLRPVPREHLATAHGRLVRVHGLSSFIAGQVIADIKWATLREAPDWFTWCAPGTGSMRGLNRVLGRSPVARGFNAEEFQQYVATITHNIAPRLRLAYMDPISAQDMQNCLCEFDKYERIRLGQGRARNTYNGTGE